jgi:membrane fusion protein, multidrug efflux system
MNARRGLILMMLALLPAACRAENEAEPPPVAPVHTLVVQPTRFEDRIMTSGIVEFPEDATLSAEIAGTIRFIATAGAPVAAGQIVAQIDAAAERAAAARAEATVIEARAVAEQAGDAVRRQAPLLRDTIISPLEFERIEAERAQAQARLLQAEAQLREAQDRLEQTRLRAPFSGRVERAFVRSGEQVSPGEDIARVVRAGRVEVTAGIPERYAGQIDAGSSATVDFQAYGLGAREAPVAFVGTAIDPRSRTFPVRIDIPNATGAIKADMLARVHVTHLVLPAALVVPLEAVLRDEQGESVLIAADSAGMHVVRRRVISTGPRGERGIVVEAGLQPGEEIIVFGQQDVAEGEFIRITQRFFSIDEVRAALAANPAGGRDP